MIAEQLNQWLISNSISGIYLELFKTLILLLSIVMLCIAADYIARRILLSFVTSLVKRSKVRWDDILLQENLFKHLAHFVPAVVAYMSIEFVFASFTLWIDVIRAGIYIYMVIISILAADSFINGCNKIYETLPVAQHRPIKGYIQVFKIFLYFIGFVLILSIVLNKEVGYFFTGLGALAAVLLLVFKDSILGLVSGVQLSANDMVRIGDWISMPSHDADGVVIEISLNTIKVQNWDNTTCMLPVYALVNSSFNNWRGMQESGGRRIKRSIRIHTKTIKFCTKEMLDKFEKIHLIADYIKSMRTEIEQHNKQNKIDTSIDINGRKLTNVGVFRKYIIAYLQNNSNIRKDMTFLVRQLQPDSKGLPIEIYVFSKRQEWAIYEDIQADIFDHILASIVVFDLKVFQEASFDDLSFEK